jgi:hypothetical protein
LEITIERALKKMVESVGGLAWKFTSPGTVGVPDRIVLLPGGRIVFVELKDAGKKPDPIQLARKRQLEMLGFDVRVIDNRDLLGALRDEIRRA